MNSKIASAITGDDLTKLMIYFQSLSDNVLKVDHNSYLNIASKIKNHKEAVFKLVDDLKKEYFTR
jgi:hypothetical protein